MNFFVFFAMIFLISRSIKISIQGNITLLTINMEDGDLDEPVQNVVIKILQESDPLLFQNFSRVVLRYKNSTHMRPPGPKDFGKMIGQPPPSPPFCDVDNVANFFFNYYFHHPDLFTQPLSEQFTIITSNDCNPVVLEIAQFLSETNTLMAVSVPDNTLSNNIKFPVTLNIFPMPNDYFIYTVAVLAKKFRWSSLNLLCNNGFGFMFEICESFGMILQNSVSKDLAWEKFTGYWLSHENEPGYQPANFSSFFPKLISRRVILIALDPFLLRQFMVAAFDQNITTGDYVFLTFGIQGIPKIDGIFWKANQNDDVKAFAAFRSLLIVTGSVTDWSGKEVFLQKIRRETERLYNFSQAPEDQNVDVPLNFLELFSVFSQTFTRVHKDLDHMTSKEFVKECSNQSYDLLTTRKIFLTEQGNSVSLISVMKLSTSGLFQGVMLCNLITSEVQTVELDWFGQNTFPSDLPYCGLNGEKCFSTRQPDLTNIGVPILCVGSTVLLLTIFIFIKRLLLESRLAYLIVHPNKSGTRRHGLRSSETSEAELDHMGSIGWLAEDPVYIKKCITGVTLKHLTHNSAFANGLVSLSRARNQYLAKFHGLFFEKMTCSFVYERSTKGSLRNVLDTNEVFYDFHIRLSLVKSLIEGLNFIHTSELKYHGVFSIDVCLLDDRYTVRIAQAGFMYLISLLNSNRTGHTNDELFGTTNNVADVALHRQHDIQNLGQIIETLFRLRDSSEGEEDKAPNNFMDQTRKAIIGIAKACRTNDPRARPTSLVLKDWIRKMGIAKQNIVELLLERLHKHSVVLEELVVQRSTALQEEMKKLDDLLLEILPRSIITRLRNHEPIIAELFESVTILFSDIPVFGRIVAECAPMEVVSFLSQIHTAFDNVVIQFDVYKVETINDSYVVASGIPMRNGNQHAEEVCRLALQLIRAGNAITVPSWGVVTICPRIGINSGFIAAGVAGTRSPRYCLFGDTMNTASRLESHGTASKIHVSETTRKLVNENSSLSSVMVFVSRGRTAIKGKGILETFWLKNGPSRHE